MDLDWAENTVTDEIATHEPNDPLNNDITREMFVDNTEHADRMEELNNEEETQRGFILDRSSIFYI